MRCAILLFEGVDIMDVAGPYEVLLTASRLEARHGRGRPFSVTTVAAQAGSVAAYGRRLAEATARQIDYDWTSERG